MWNSEFSSLTLLNNADRSAWSRRSVALTGVAIRVKRHAMVIINGYRSLIRFSLMSYQPALNESAAAVENRVKAQPATRWLINRQRKTATAMPMFEDIVINQQQE